MGVLGRRKEVGGQTVSEDGCGNDEQGEIIFSTNAHECILRAGEAPMQMKERSFLPWLRPKKLIEERNVTDFFVFPVTEEEVAQNEFLWKVAQESKYDAKLGNEMLEKNILWLEFPPDLLAFLRSVDLGGLKRCIMDVLGSVLELEDRSSTEVVRDLIAPSIFQDLPQFLGRRRAGEPPEPASSQLDDIIEWSLGENDGDGLEEDDSAAQWRVQISGAIFYDDEDADPDDEESFFLWRKYCDWVAFRVLLCNRLGKQRRVASKCLSNLIRKKRRCSLFQKVSIVKALAKDPRTLLSSLPMEVVDSVLLPNVILAVCSLDSDRLCLERPSAHDLSKPLGQHCPIGLRESRQTEPRTSLPNLPGNTSRDGGDNHSQGKSLSVA